MLPDWVSELIIDEVSNHVMANPGKDFDISVAMASVFVEEGLESGDLVLRDDAIVKSLRDYFQNAQFGKPDSDDSVREAIYRNEAADYLKSQSSKRAFQVSSDLINFVMKPVRNQIRAGSWPSDPDHAKNRLRWLFRQRLAEHLRLRSSADIDDVGD